MWPEPLDLGVPAPGGQYICDMAGNLDYDQTFLLLYDERSGPSTGRLVLQRVQHWNGHGDPRWPQHGITVAPPGPRFVGDSKVVRNDVTGGGIVFWEEEPNNIFAQAVDSLGASVWATRTHSVTEAGSRMSVASDGQNGAVVTWHGTDQGLYATRINESVAVRGDFDVSTFVRRKATSGVEPIHTARAVACPKGEEDELIFRVELSGQVMTPFSADALTLDWPPATGDSAFHSFRSAIADSAMRLDGDRYRTTITLRELGGAGNDSVAILANGFAFRGEINRPRGGSRILCLRTTQTRSTPRRPSATLSRKQATSI